MNDLADLRAWVDAAPSGTMIPAAELAGLLADLDIGEPAQPAPVAPERSANVSWRLLLWTVDPETRIGRDEMLEAVGRPLSWLYRHTGEAATHRIPHRKLDGQLVFVVGEVRLWLRDREEIVVGGSVRRGGLRLHGSDAV